MYVGFSSSTFLPTNLADLKAFSVTRFRGDEDKAKNVYKGIQPLVAEDIAEDIVWAASRKDHMSVSMVKAEDTRAYVCI